MVDLVKRFGVDLDAETNGAWFNVGDDVKFKLARWQNAEFSKVLTEELDAHRGAPITPELDRLLMDRVIARTLFKGWQNVEMEGEALECNMENAMRVLAHPQLQDLRQSILSFTQNAENYRVRSVVREP